MQGQQLGEDGLDLTTSQIYFLAMLPVAGGINGSGG